MSDYFRTFPSYTGFDCMTHESTYIEQFNFSTVEQAIEYASEQMDSENILLWFRRKEPIAFISRGDITWTSMKRGVNLNKVLGLKHSVEFTSGTVCSIYPIELFNLTMVELSKHKYIKQVCFAKRLNMLKFKGLFASDIATNDKVFMLCTEVHIDSEPIEVDRLTWQSTVFSANQVILYNTTELWQVMLLKNSSDNLKPGACVGKQAAAELFNSTQYARYYQTEPSIGTLASIQHLAPSSQLVVLHRKQNRINFEVLAPISLEL